MRHLHSWIVALFVIASLFLTSGCDLILEVLEDQLLESEEEGSRGEQLEEVTIDDLGQTENFRRGALEHILEGELNARGQAVGFHYDGLASKKGEIIEGTRTGSNEQGVFEAEISVEGVKKESNRGRSSFFPDEWTAQEVVDAINEAYENRQFITGNTYEGLSDSGVVVRMYLDNKEKIISAFPLY